MRTIVNLRSAPNSPPERRRRQTGAVQRITGLIGAVGAAVADLVAFPTRQLTAFLDDADAVWIVDGFSDPDE